MREKSIDDRQTLQQNHLNQKCSKDLHKYKQVDAKIIEKEHQHSMTFYEESTIRRENNISINTASTKNSLCKANHCHTQTHIYFLKQKIDYYIAHLQKSRLQAYF